MNYNNRAQVNQEENWKENKFRTVIYFKRKTLLSINGVLIRVNKTLLYKFNCKYWLNSNWWKQKNWQENNLLNSFKNLINKQWSFEFFKTSLSMIPDNRVSERIPLRIHTFLVKIL